MKHSKASNNSLVEAWNRLERSLRDTDNIESHISDNQQMTGVVSSASVGSLRRGIATTQLSSSRSQNQFPDFNQAQHQTGEFFKSNNNQQLQHQLRPSSSGQYLSRQPPSRAAGQSNRPQTAFNPSSSGNFAAPQQRRMQSAQLNKPTSYPTAGGAMTITNTTTHQTNAPVSSVSLLKSVMNIRAQSRPSSKKSISNPHLSKPSDLEILSGVPLQQVDELISKSELVKSLKVEMILDLFNAKCRDMGVEYMPDQAVRFIEKLKKNCRLKTLNLSENTLGVESAHILGAILVANDHFVRLNLQRNCLSNTGAAIISEALKYNLNLIHLDISSNNIVQEGFAVFFESLNDNHSLISIDVSSKEGLNRNKLGIEGSNALEDYLSVNSSVQFLNISGTSIGDEGSLAIMRGVKHNKSLAFLDMSNNELKPSFAAVLVESLLGQDLLQLNLSSNLLSDVGVENIAYMFKSTASRNYKLTDINLSHNRITSMGIAHLFEAMQRNNTLKKVILDDNDFSGNRFTTVENMLWENSHLEVLSMNSCQIDDVGGDWIGFGLSKNVALKALYLRDNNLKDSGTNEIANGIKASETLEELDLSMCHITDKSGVLIGEALRNCKSMRILSLRENSLHDYTGMVLMEAIRENLNMQKCDILRNAISYKYQEEISRCLDLNLELLKKNLVPSYIRTMEELRLFEKGKYEDASRQQVLDRLLRDMQKQVIDRRGNLDRESKLEEKRTLEVTREFEEVKSLRKVVEAEVTAKEKAQNDRLTEIEEEITQTSNLIGQMAGETIKKSLQKKERKDFLAKVTVQLHEQLKNQTLKLKESSNAARAQEQLIKSNQMLIVQQREKVESLMDKLYRLENNDMSVKTDAYISTKTAIPAGGTTKEIPKGPAKKQTAATLSPKKNNQQPPQKKNNNAAVAQKKN